MKRGPKDLEQDVVLNILCFMKYKDDQVEALTKEVKQLKENLNRADYSICKVCIRYAHNSNMKICSYCKTNLNSCFECKSDDRSIIRAHTYGITKLYYCETCAPQKCRRCPNFADDDSGICYTCSDR